MHSMKQPKILTLNVKKKYFEEIKSGTKKFEYREIKPYWTNRLKREYDLICIKLGYPAKEQYDKMIFRKYKGYEIQTIKHEVFQYRTLPVYAIRL